MKKYSIFKENAMSKIIYLRINPDDYLIWIRDKINILLENNNLNILIYVNSSYDAEFLVKILNPEIQKVIYNYKGLHRCSINKNSEFNISDQFLILIL